MFWTYILKSINQGSYYIGSCKDTEKRFALHNKGAVSSTKRYAPWELVYQEQHKNLKDARERELQIKSWKKRAMIEKLIEHYKINK